MEERLLYYEKNDWVEKFREEKLRAYNALPLPKWKRLKLDGLIIPDVKAYKKYFINEGKYKKKGIVVKDIRNSLNEYEELQRYMNLKIPFGVNEKFTLMGEALYNSGALIKVHENIRVEEPVRINYKIDPENPVIIDHNLIIAEENSLMTIIMDYSTDSALEEEGSPDAFHNGVTKVYAGEGSVVNIIKVQRMNSKAAHFDSNIAFVETGARVNWISVEIGSGISSTCFVTNLDGEASEADLSSIYLGDLDRRLDLNYTMNHRGVRSASRIETRGVLKDNSKKIFRGNIDFKPGSRRAKGSEEEYVILLDPTVKSEAIPGLFCQEDDVEGQHAASAGQIEEDKLFYLMSRGLNEKEAKKMIVEASFKPIIEKIQSEEVKKIIDEEIHRRLVYA